MESDVIIIGGGIIGLSIARELNKRGMSRITLLERGVCGEEASWAAAGMLGPQAEANGGGAFFDLCCSSREMYPQFADDLMSETGVDIRLDRTGTIYAAFTEEDVRELRERYKWQSRAGLDVRRLTAEEALALEPAISPDIREALLFATDWQVENRAVLAALRRYAELNGIDVIENTTVHNIILHDGRAVGVEAGNKSFKAKYIVMAAGAWTSLIGTSDFTMPFKVEPVRGQIVSFILDSPLFRHVISSRRGYLVPRADGRVLVGSTTEHAGFDKSTTVAAMETLADVAVSLVPGLRGLQAADHWAGLRPYATNELPLLGTVSGVQNLFAAAGHYRNGILLAPATSKILADCIVEGRVSKMSEPFTIKQWDARAKATQVA